jgi:hypothetical protein
VAKVMSSLPASDGQEASYRYGSLPVRQVCVERLAPLSVSRDFFDRSTTQLKTGKSAARFPRIDVHTADERSARNHQEIFATLIWATVTGWLL